MLQILIVTSAVWLAVLSPGADFAMVSRTSLVEGRRAALAAAVGIALGCWIHVGYAVAGLSLAGRYLAEWLIVLKVLGAGYLVWLGGTMAMARPVDPALDAAAPAGGVRRALRRGFLTNALNPKTSIFVVSLYAQVIGDAHPFAQAAYGAVISGSHLGWFALVAVLLSRPALRGQALRYQRQVNLVLGLLLVGLGLLLGTADLHTGRPG